MYIYIHKCAYVYTHNYIHIHVCIYAFINKKPACMYTFMFTHISIHTHTYMSICKYSIRTHTDYEIICSHIDSHIFTYKTIYTYICTRTYTSQYIKQDNCSGPHAGLKMYTNKYTHLHITHERMNLNTSQEIPEVDPPLNQQVRLER